MTDRCLTCDTDCTMKKRCPCCSRKRNPGYCSCPQGPILGARRYWRAPRCARCTLFVEEKYMR